MVGNQRQAADRQSNFYQYFETKAGIERIIQTYGMYFLIQLFFINHFMQPRFVCGKFSYDY